jgi:Tol biopolymer transport system component
MTVSPDGAKLAFVGTDSVGNPMLFVQSLTDLTAPPVQVVSTTSAPAFSPGGDALAYVMSQELFVTSLKGGSPRHIAAVGVSRGLDWGEDSSLVVATLGGLLRISATGAQIDTIAKQPDSVTYYRAPSFAKRDLVLFEITHTTTSSSELAALNLRDRRVTLLGIVGSRPILVDGHILVYFLTDGSVWGTEFNPRTLKSSGAARPIADQVSIGGLSRPMAAVGSNGTMIYVTGLSSTQREVVLIDRATKQLRVLSKTQQAWRFPRYSPNGKQIAITVDGLNGVANGDIWVFGADGTGPLRVTSDHASYQAEWDPDGLNLIYPHRLSIGSVALMRSPANGTPGTVQLLTRRNPIYESRVTPDHKTLIWREDAFANNRDIYFAPLDSPTVARPLLNSTYDEKGLALSPDGKWLAYVSNESNQNEVYVRRLDPNAPRVLVSTHGGTEPRWAGSEIFYRRGDTVLVARVMLGTEARVSPAIALFSGAYRFTNYEPLWDVSPDGRTFAMVRGIGAEQAQLVLYANWAAHW